MKGAYDVVVVGAGAAGVGIGVALQDLGLEDYALLERLRVGASFALWPEEMRFISPSFTSNPFGLPDLNAVTLSTSPALTLGKEHPSGKDYALYLRALAEHYALPVRTGVNVTSVQPSADGFRLETSKGPLRARFVVWAAGEFQYPRLDPFPGAEGCLHNSRVNAWAELDGDDFLVIGGYESGLDAAINLVHCGKRVTVLERTPVWESRSSDPSLTLSPYTRERLSEALLTGRLALTGGVEVVRAGRRGGCYEVYGTQGEVWTSPVQPILATGFRGGLARLEHLFETREDGGVRVGKADESTRTPGLFVVGPTVRHGEGSLCFIYKFRGRFAVVAREIGERLGLETGAFVELYRRHAMFLDDLACCDEACVC